LVSSVGDDFPLGPPTFIPLDQTSATTPSERKDRSAHDDSKDQRTNAECSRLDDKQRDWDSEGDGDENFDPARKPHVQPPTQLSCG
jgi:hypothetical protein